MLLASRISERQFQLFFSNPRSYVSLNDKQIAALTDSKKSIRLVTLDAILKELKTVFGDTITIEHFFSIDITKRLTIDQIKLLFNQRTMISNAPISNENSTRIDGGSHKKSFRKNGSRKRGSRKRGSRKKSSRKNGSCKKCGSRKRG